eukprot:scaffold2088_cov399-Prasinococcus_capsulatus_cf.AAC.33
MIPAAGYGHKPTSGWHTMSEVHSFLWIRCLPKNSAGTNKDCPFSSAREPDKLGWIAQRGRRRALISGPSLRSIRDLLASCPLDR